MKKTPEPTPKILMYHGITSPGVVLPEDRETGAEIYDLSLELFEQHMAYLKKEGYSQQVDPDHLHDNIKKIIITFDDGETNNYKVALPILKKYGFKAYFFIIVGKVGKKGYMNWEEIRDLHNEGMTIGSHGLSHQILTNLIDTQIEEELRASKRVLEVNLNTEINAISIPRGFCNDDLINKAHALGYKTVFISDRPRGITSKCFSRLAVKNKWSVDRLSRALEGKVTPGERIGGIAKKAVQAVLREGGYNFLRSFLIKMFR